MRACLVYDSGAVIAATLLGFASMAELDWIRMMRSFAEPAAIIRFLDPRRHHPHPRPIPLYFALALPQMTFRMLRDDIARRLIVFFG